MKFWQNWPYWLKGGAIGAGITVASIVLVYGCDFVDTSSNSFVCLIPLVVGPLFPFAWLMDNNPQLSNLPVFFLPVIALVSWFIVGSIIGWFVGYLKSGKNTI